MTNACAGVNCGGATSPLVLPLRPDTALACSARVFGGDLANTHSQCLTDSFGRNTQTRMTLAAYALDYWVEVFSLDDASPSGALVTLAPSLDLCLLLVGFCVMERPYVITLGRDK